MKLKNKKTGEIGVLEATTYHGGRPDNIIEVYEMGIGAVKVLAQYKTLEELLEEWEDYKPKEPLIKDEKIRKAVRAWAEACEIESDDAIMVSGLAPAFTRFYTSMYEIDIKTESSLELDEHRDYVIAELCGEEEE